MSVVHIARTMQAAMKIQQQINNARAQLQIARKQQKKDKKDASSAIAMNTFCGVHRHLSLVRVPIGREFRIMVMANLCLPMAHFI